MVSPLEYETLGLMGSNCGLTDPDDVARLNFEANDLGVDTIEIGATLGVLMEAGQGAFGDVAFMHQALDDIRAGNERGRLLAQGTARVGAHFKVARVSGNSTARLASPRPTTSCRRSSTTRHSRPAARPSAMTPPR